MVLPNTAVEANSNDYLKFESITTADGLSHNTVSAIYQDHYGYMWFGTTAGLNKYDGINYYIFKNDTEKSDSISNSNISFIYESRDYQMWIGTSWGLNKFDRETETFIRYLNDPDNSNTISNNHITSIYKDSDGILWIGTEEGLNTFNQEMETFTRYLNDPDNSNTISNNHITSIYKDSSGILWIGTIVGINRLDFETKTFTRYSNSSNDIQKSNNDYITSICEDNYGYLWIGTRLGLNKLNVKEMTFYTYIPDSDNPNSLNTDRITKLYKDTDGNLWIGTLYGINKINFNKQAFKYYYTGMLNNNAVSNIRSIDAKTLWLKTRLGVIQFDSEDYLIKGNWASIFIDQNYSNSKMNSFCISTDGCLWAGTEGSGLEKFNPLTEELTIYTYSPVDKNSISSNTIISLYANEDGIVYIGTDNGLCSFNINTGLFTRYNDNSIYSKSINNSEIWIIYETANNDLWVGNNTGFYKLDHQTEEVICIINNSDFSNVTYNSDDNIVSSLYEDSQGVLWIVTDHGLYCYDTRNGEFILHGLEDVLPNTLIRDVIEDNNGDIWISTGGTGLWKLSRSNGYYINYGIDDGLQTDLFLFRSSYKTEDGELFFGTIIGLISFYPEDLVDDTNIPIVLINDFELLDRNISFDEPIEDIKEIILPYSDNSFELDFVALNYDSPEDNQYAYKLEGFDEDWHYCNADNSSTRYTNLNSGEYTFIVIASNSDGIWNQDGTSLNIIITSPYWQKWWFILLCIAVASFIVIIGVKLRTYNIEKYTQNIERQVAERTHQLSKKSQHLEIEIKQHRITEKKLKEVIDRRIKYNRALVHELKTPLTPLVAASDFLVANLSEEPFNSFARSINTGATNLSNKIDALMDLARGEVGMLKLEYSYVDSNKLITEVYEYMKPEASKNNQSLLLNIPSSLPMIRCDRDRIKQTLFNLIHNAFKFSPNGGEISIIAKKDDAGIIITVQDNGCGISDEEQKDLFKPYNRLNSDKAKLSGLGIGLSLVKRNVELHGGRVWVNSRKGKGSTFSFYLPLTPPDSKKILKKKEKKIEDCYY
jgi:signal transduction histidine kinase/ligand-binding sensor domain-containing protein